MPFRKLTVVALILALLLSALPAVADAGNTVTLTYSGTFETGMARSMLTLINRMRTGSDAWYWNEDDTEKIVLTNLQELRYDYGLEKVAMQRAAELAFYYSHTRPDGTDCFSAYPDSFHYGYRGENIAFGYSSTQSMFDGWAETNEPYDGQGHRRNMLSSNFRSFGIGCFRYNGRLYWAQEFSSLSSTDTATVPSGTVTVESLASNVSSLGVEDGKLSLELNTTLPLSNIRVTAKSNDNILHTVSCDIAGMTWSTGNSGIVSISGGNMKGVSKGKTTLTGAAGALTVELPVKVLQMIQSFRVSLSGKRVFDNYGYTSIAVSIPSLTQADSYRVVQSDLNTRTYTYNGVAAGSRGYNVWSYDDDHPVLVTFGVFALDDEGFTIAADSKNIVVYPSSGVMNLPSSLTAVSAEAFQKTPTVAFVVPDGCGSIGSKAFADCGSLYSIRIPGSVSSIAGDAFNGSNSGMIIVAPAGSYAQSWANDKGYTFFEEN